MLQDQELGGMWLNTDPLYQQAMDRTSGHILKNRNEFVFILSTQPVCIITLIPRLRLLTVIIENVM